MSHRTFTTGERNEAIRLRGLKYTKKEISRALRLRESDTKTLLEAVGMADPLPRTGKPTPSRTDEAAKPEPPPLVYVPKAISVVGDPMTPILWWIKCDHGNTAGRCLRCAAPTIALFR